MILGHEKSLRNGEEEKQNFGRDYSAPPGVKTRGPEASHARPGGLRRRD